MIEMPSLGDAVGLRNRIIELESEVLRLKRIQARKDSLIEKLRRKCGIKARTSKTEIANLIIGGSDMQDVINKTGCGKSSFYRIRKEMGLGKKKTASN